MGKLSCKLYDKVINGEPLSEKDYRFMGEVVKEVLTFMAETKILPSPQNYERWFLIFCYVKENNLKLSKPELIDLYFDTYNARLGDLGRDTANIVEKVAEELFEEVHKLLKAVSEHNRDISKGKERLEELSVRTEEDIKEVLLRIVKEVEELKGINHKFISKLEEQKAEIEKLRHELRRVKEEASVDPLTGLRNRRSFERALTEFFRDFRRFRYPFSVIMFDLDNFKSINDTYGHLAGDKVLREVGHILRNYLRAKDIAARTGGEEFAIILPGIMKDEAILVAERLRKVIANHSIDYEGKKINMTASFGVVEMGDDIEAPEDILKKADERLYTAKRTGKDKVVS